MPNDRRPQIAGGTYFITQVTYQREPWTCSDVGRKAIREAIAKVRERYPFVIDAFVLLPEHFHCLLTLPPDDHDFSVRLRLIKAYSDFDLVKPHDSLLPTPYFPSLLWSTHLKTAVRLADR